MKKVINGVHYDTKKALKIGSHSHGNYHVSQDITNWSATLYRMPSSAFFLHGTGGEMTRFGKYGDDGLRCGGEKIIPMGQEEALGWAGRYLNADTIELHFGVVPADS